MLFITVEVPMTLEQLLERKLKQPEYSAFLEKFIIDNEKCLYRCTSLSSKRSLWIKSRMTIKIFLEQMIQW